MVGSLPLKQQYERAIHGTNPQTGKPGKPADASKFFNSTDIDNIIIQAKRQYYNNPTAYPNGNVNITLSRPIGEGYIGNTKANIKNGYTVGEYRWSNIATVGIDVKTGKAYTAYPNLKLGYRK